MAEKRLGLKDIANALRPAPVIVLVRPQLGENIGAVARAMLNFGIHRLRLVDPRDGWPNPAARGPASGADLVIDGAEVFASVDDALADCRYALATTARPRELLVPVMSPQEAADTSTARILRPGKGRTFSRVMVGRKVIFLAGCYVAPLPQQPLHVGLDLGGVGPFLS